jgi:hypothetical protein
MNNNSKYQNFRQLRELPDLEMLYFFQTDKWNRFRIENITTHNAICYVYGLRKGRSNYKAYKLNIAKDISVSTMNSTQSQPSQTLEHE